MNLLEVTGLKKVYTQRLGAKPNVALRNVSFSAAKGEYIAIMGESGSGKTTLLNILATLDKATAGVVMLSGVDITKIKDSDSALFRREHLGFVFRISTCSIHSPCVTIFFCRSCLWAKATMR